jgi:hypothetical protein
MYFLIFLLSVRLRLRFYVLGFSLSWFLGTFSFSFSELLFRDSSSICGINDTLYEVFEKVEHFRVLDGLLPVDVPLDDPPVTQTGYLTNDMPLFVVLPDLHIVWRMHRPDLA